MGDGGCTQHDDDAMDVVVRDLHAAADALESGDGNATAAATSQTARKRKDASSLMVRYVGAVVTSAGRTHTCHAGSCPKGSLLCFETPSAPHAMPT